MADVGLTFMEPTMHNAAPCEEYQELHQATNHLAWSMEGQPRLQKAINHLGLLFCSNHEQTSSTWNVWAGQNCSPEVNVTKEQIADQLQIVGFSFLAMICRLNRTSQCLLF